MAVVALPERPIGNSHTLWCHHPGSTLQHGNFRSAKQSWRRAERSASTLARRWRAASVSAFGRASRCILRRGIASGEFRPVDIAHVVYCVLGPLLFTVLWQHSLGPHDDRPLDVQAVCRAHLDLMLHGLYVPTPLPSQRPSQEGSMDDGSR